MIKVELQFATEKDLIAFFTGRTVPVVTTTVGDTAAPVKEATTKPGKPAATPAATEAAPVATTTPAAESPSDPKPAAAETSAAPSASSAKPDASPAAISYTEVGAAITAKVKTHRQHVIDTLAAFNVKKGPELKPEQYADFLKALG